jgi:hypothetical protein
MRFAFRLVVAVAVVMGLLTGTASAQFSDPQDRIFNTEKLFDSESAFPVESQAATHSDFAFWGKHAVLGWYTGTTGGALIFDVSNPASPDLIRNFPCNGNQNDPILWDRNGNGVADLMLLAVDRTMDGPACTDPVSMRPNPAWDPTDNNPPQFIRFDENPNGWEGVRVFTVSDDHGEHQVRQRRGQPAPGRLRVVVSAAARADLRRHRCRRTGAAAHEREQPVRGRERPGGRGPAA